MFFPNPDYVVVVVVVVVVAVAVAVVIAVVIVVVVVVVLPLLLVAARIFDSQRPPGRRYYTPRRHYLYLCAGEKAMRRKRWEGRREGGREATTPVAEVEATASHRVQPICRHCREGQRLACRTVTRCG